MVKKKDKINKTLAGTYKYQNREIYLEREEIFLLIRLREKQKKKGNKKEKRKKRSEWCLVETQIEREALDSTSFRPPRRSFCRFAFQICGVVIYEYESDLNGYPRLFNCFAGLGSKLNNFFCFLRYGASVHLVKLLPVSSFFIPGSAGLAVCCPWRFSFGVLCQ